jgi:hypothetical protein
MFAMLEAIAAAEAGRRGHDQHQPERRVGPGDETCQRDHRDEQQHSADDGPVSSAETGHRKGVQKPQQRADKPRQSNELKQLVGRIVKADLW